MPIPAQRVFNPQQVRNFGRFGDAVEVPALADVQTRSYDRFLQLVVVSQLHRSPGVDFTEEAEGERKLHSCRIIPERGSWIEINVTKKEALGVRIDQSGKFSAMTLLRAMDPAYSTDADIIRAFHG